MAKKKLVVTISHDIQIPASVKIIRNDNFVTLAKKKGNIISVLTMESHIQEEGE